MEETEVQADPPTAADGVETASERPEPAEQRSPNQSSESGSRVSAQLTAPVTVPRWVQLVLLPLALLGLWELGRAMGTVLVVVVAAGVIAVILNPLAKQFQRVV